MLTECDRVQVLYAMKAFRIMTEGHDPGIVFAKTRAKAMWLAVSSFCEAFNVCPKDALSRVRIFRAPEYDWRAYFCGQSIYAEEYVKREIEHEILHGYVQTCISMLESIRRPKPCDRVYTDVDRRSPPR